MRVVPLHTLSEKVYTFSVRTRYLPHWKTRFFWFTGEALCLWLQTGLPQPTTHYCLFIPAWPYFHKRITWIPSESLPFILYLAYRVRMSFSLKDLSPPISMAFLLYHFCGCLSRKHCWKRKSKQNPCAATQFVNLSLYAQLLMSSGHIGHTQ